MQKTELRKKVPYSVEERDASLNTPGHRSLVSAQQVVILEEIKFPLQLLRKTNGHASYFDSLQSAMKNRGHFSFNVAQHTGPCWTKT